jgi:hypothetical protein
VLGEGEMNGTLLSIDHRSMQGGSPVHFMMEGYFDPTKKFDGRTNDTTILGGNLSFVVKM